MSKNAFLQSLQGGGAGGGSIDPSQVVDDIEATNLYAGIISTVHGRADALANAISNARADILNSSGQIGRAHV